MADEFDKASDLEQLDRDMCIAIARNMTDSLEATGFCLWCGEPVEKGVRWCDSFCRDDHGRYNILLKNTGSVR